VAASAATLDYIPNGLLQNRVDGGALQAGVANNGLFRGDGGRVQPPTKAMGGHARSVVDNTGIVGARSVGVANRPSRPGCGTVDTGAHYGARGIWLLDPKFIEVKVGGIDPVTGNVFASIPGGTSTIDPLSINLSSSTVVLQANTDITFTDAISMAIPSVGLTA